MQLKTILMTIGATAIVTLTGCSSQKQINPEDYLPSFLLPYRLPVTQGNLVTSEMIAQLENNMSMTQVQYILGLPLLRDQFHPNRWDYVYFYLPSKGQQQLRRLTIWFNEEGRVDHWTSDPMPTEEQADELILGKIKTFKPVSEEGEKANSDAKNAADKK